MNDIQDRIVDICKHDGGSGWISAIYFMKKTKKTYDTIAKHLKILCDTGLLEREVAGKPWRYYYRLKGEGVKRQ